MIEKFIEQAHNKGFPIESTKFWARTYVLESSVYVEDWQLWAMDKLVERTYSDSQSIPQ